MAFLQTKTKFSFYLFAVSVLLSSTVFSQENSEGNDGWSEEWDEGGWEENGESQGIALTGFAEFGYGQFYNHGGFTKNRWLDERKSLYEARARLETEKQWGPVHSRFKVDTYFDGVSDDVTARVREAVFSGSPLSDMDVRVGRQILTWGTGDLVFLNDMFPKDWQSFFSGRDQEYLKAPSDAFKWSWYKKNVNVDVVWTPEFDGDNYLTGERFSYFSPLMGSVTGNVNSGIVKAEQINDDEWALRLYQNSGSIEWAVYGYHGYGKQPKAVDLATFSPRFYKLSALGASIRLPLLGGITNVETAWHISREDRSGSDPFVPNDQWRFLLGYERELLPRLIPKLTLGVQYYLEKTLDYNTQQRVSFFPQYESPEHRDIVTVRLTKQMLQDNLTLSLFNYYSPAEKDSYWIASANYRYSDQLSFTLGGNGFEGKDAHSFFGQLEDNSNFYFRVRLSF